MSKPDDEHLAWPILRTAGTRADFRVFTVDQHVAAHPQTGDERLFSVIHSPDWVNVIALTPDDAVVLVRQFRHGTRSVTLEIPGGMVDAGETFIQAGARELREETGYAAASWRQIGIVEPNPAIQDNRCATVLGLDARPVGEMQPDAGEFIEVTTRPLTSIGALVMSGEIRHALVVAAFFHLLEHAGGWRRP